MQLSRRAAMARSWWRGLTLAVGPPIRRSTVLGGAAAAPAAGAAAAPAAAVGDTEVPPRHRFDPRTFGLPRPGSAERVASVVGPDRPWRSLEAARAALGLADLQRHDTRAWAAIQAALEAARRFVESTNYTEGAYVPLPEGEWLVNRSLEISHYTVLGGVHAAATRIRLLHPAANPGAERDPDTGRTRWRTDHPDWETAGGIVEDTVVRTRNGLDAEALCLWLSMLERRDLPRRHGSRTVLDAERRAFRDDLSAADARKDTHRVLAPWQHLALSHVSVGLADLSVHGSSDRDRVVSTYDPPEREYPAILLVGMNLLLGTVYVGDVRGPGVILRSSSAGANRRLDDLVAAQFGRDVPADDEAADRDGDDGPPRPAAAGGYRDNPIFDADGFPVGFDPAKKARYLEPRPGWRFGLSNNSVIGYLNVERCRSFGAWIQGNDLEAGNVMIGAVGTGAWRPALDCIPAAVRPPEDYVRHAYRTMEITDPRPDRPPNATLEQRWQAGTALINGAAGARYHKSHITAATGSQVWLMRNQSVHWDFLEVDYLRSDPIWPGRDRPGPWSAFDGVNLPPQFGLLSEDGMGFLQINNFFVLKTYASRLKFGGGHDLPLIPEAGPFAGRPLDREGAANADPRGDASLPLDYAAWLGGFNRGCYIGTFNGLQTNGIVLGPRANTITVAQATLRTAFERHQGRWKPSASEALWRRANLAFFHVHLGAGRRGGPALLNLTAANPHDDVGHFVVCKGNGSLTDSRLVLQGRTRFAPLAHVERGRNGPPPMRNCIVEAMLVRTDEGTTLTDDAELEAALRRHCDLSRVLVRRAD
jgi:hypothetical protein